MAAMVVWFIFAMVVVWLWRSVVEKTEKVLVLKKVIRRTAICLDEIYRVNPRLNLWCLLKQTYLERAMLCIIFLPNPNDSPWH